jgi:ribosome maturation factor RimP
MNHNDKNIIDAVEEIVKKDGYFLIDAVVRGAPNLKVIEIYIDREGNVSAEDCAEISKEIKFKLDEILLVDTNYRLDVSSPGVDRPLKFLQQFPKHVNRNFEVSYKSDEELKTIKGKLIKIEGDYLTFNVKNTETIIKFQNITKAKVIISFS